MVGPQEAHPRIHNSHNINNINRYVVEKVYRIIVFITWSIEWALKLQRSWNKHIELG